MTVQTAVQMWSKHSGDVISEGGQKYKASIQEAYSVVCDPSDTLRDVSNAPGLPYIGTLYPGSSQIRVRSLKPQQVSPIYWIVDIGYEGSFGPAGITDSPLNEPPIIKWGKTETEEPVDEDLDGEPICTVNGEPIEGITKTISDVTCSIQRNFAAVNLAAIYQYLHSVNSDTFLGFAPGVCRMTEFSAEQVWAETGGGYWRASAGFQFRWPYNTTPAKAWYARVRHEGFRVKVGTDIVNAKDAEGQPASKPVLLASNGTEETVPSSAHWLEFEIYQKLPYSSLGLT